MKTPCRYCGFDAARQSDEDCPKIVYKYAPIYRPPGFATVPSGWTLVERPRQACGFDRRTELPVSQHTFGVIGYEKPLTEDQIISYQLLPV